MPSIKNACLELEKDPDLYKTVGKELTKLEIERVGKLIRKYCEIAQSDKGTLQDYFRADYYSRQLNRLQKELNEYC